MYVLFNCISPCSAASDLFLLLYPYKQWVSFCFSLISFLSFFYISEILLFFSCVCFSMLFPLNFVWYTYKSLSLKVEQVICCFSAFEFSAFKGGKFISWPQCLAFPPPPFGEWASDAAQLHLRHHNGSC